MAWVDEKVKVEGWITQVERGSKTSDAYLFCSALRALLVALDALSGVTNVALLDAANVFTADQKMPTLELTTQQKVYLGDYSISYSGLWFNSKAACSFSNFAILWNGSNVFIGSPSMLEMWVAGSTFFRMQQYHAAYGNNPTPPSDATLLVQSCNEAWKALIVKAANAAQTANLEEWQDSTGATKLLVGGSGTLRHVGRTVAQLPASPAAGTVAHVTDGTAALAWGATVTGGGSTPYLVWYNGTAWTVIGK